MNLLLTLTVFLSFSLIFAIEIDCNFRTHPTHGYGCDVTSINIKSSQDCAVTKIHGDHLEEKSDNDVKYLNITSKAIEYFPREIYKKFKNIQKIYLETESLKIISDSDLLDFGDDLTYLSISKSSLIFIPENLFESTQNISYLYISSQKLENIQKNAFKPILKSIKTFGVDFKCSGDDYAQNNQQARDLIEKLEISCSKPDYVPKIEPRDCKKDDETDNLVYWIFGIISVAILLIIIAILIIKRILRHRSGNFEMS